jgi:hypothetical protein
LPAAGGSTVPWPGAIGDFDETAVMWSRWYAACKDGSAPGHGAPAIPFEENM